MVEYKSFYSHARKLVNDDMDALQFAFGFKDIHSDKLCVIKAARISTDKQQIPLQVSPEYRFTVPVERALRLADAQVILTLGQASNTCDMSVQLETKPEYLKTTYSIKELLVLLKQYKAFFEDMGGFLSFMMPDVEGLNFQFADKKMSQQLNNELHIVNGSLTLSNEQLLGLSALSLPEAPLRITALTVK